MLWFLFLTVGGEAVPIEKRGDPMNRLRGLLRKFEFHMLGLLFGFICLSWPFMSVFEHKHPGGILAYLFLVWTFLIVLLFLMGRSLRATGDADREEEEKGSS